MKIHKRCAHIFIFSLRLSRIIFNFPTTLSAANAERVDIKNSRYLRTEDAEEWLSNVEILSSSHSQCNASFVI